MFFSDFEENNLLCNSLPLTAGADSPSQRKAQFRDLAQLQLVGFSTACVKGELEIAVCLCEKDG